MSTYSRANRKVQWFQNKFGGSRLNLTAKTTVVVVHTTEGTSWPSYSGGATAPNYTGLPPIAKKRFGSWRAHFEDETSSRALRNLSGGVETNSLNAIQIELIGTCDPKHRKSWNGEGRVLAGRDYVFWPEATDAQLKWLAELLADLHRRHGLQLKAPKRFIAYPESYGDSSVRMSGSEWRNAVGVVGHQHVTENSHGDPGNINIDRILTFAKNKVSSRPSVQFIRTRGKAVEAAIGNLQAAEGSGRRRSLIDSALAQLNKIPKFKVKKK